MLGSGSAVIQLLLVVSSIIYSAADDGFGNYALNSITGAFDGLAPNCEGECVQITGTRQTFNELHAHTHTHTHTVVESSSSSLIFNVVLRVVSVLAVVPCYSHHMSL